MPQSILRQVIRNCSSIGLSSRKSRSPVRTSSANSLQFSRKSISIRPFSAKKQPTKNRYCVLGPAGDVLGLAEDRPVEGEQDAQPEHLDRDLDQEVAPKRHLAAQRVPRQAPEQPEVASDPGHVVSLR